MMKRILVANRGEIALRVFKTCRKMGIETVSVFADDDSSLKHACAADINISLGGGRLSETYLNQDKIIAIAKEHNVDGIHPGYGFLSENTDFCKKVNAAGIRFIGPSNEAIELMGDKKTSKVAMEKLGIPLVPGYHGDDQDEQVLLSEAVKIGFPVLIKATAGGGGKGMRIVESEASFKESLASAKREAMNAFSNDKVLLEKYIINPRHIEVQLVSDGQGNHFHFFERECSIQRRYQKVIEEAPACALSGELRKKLCETAVKIAKGINYIGAGTIEYIFTENQEFYFLEMNTRLQVEHPVTEETTGFDLVELQIKAANGEKFDFKQSDVTQTGHAFECRIYAENPDNNFFPTSGKISSIISGNGQRVRLDCGYFDGNSISTSYDPMLAKLTVFGEDREKALSQAVNALDEVIFGGVKTNRDYLKRILNHKDFVAGSYHTHFIQNNEKDLKAREISVLSALDTMAGFIFSEATFEKNIWNYNKKTYQKKFTLNEKDLNVDVLWHNEKLLKLVMGEKSKTYRFDGCFENKTFFYSEGVDLSFEKFLFDTIGTYQAFMGGYEVLLKEHKKAQANTGAALMSEGSLQSPMPGKIFKLFKKENESVSAGETVMIVEAMKMEHAIRATKDGILKKIFFKEGEQVQGGATLCEIE